MYHFCQGLDKCCSDCCQCINKCCGSYCQCIGEVFSTPFSFCTFLASFVTIIPAILMAAALFLSQSYTCVQPIKLQLLIQVHLFLYDFAVCFYVWGIILFVTWTSLGHSWYDMEKKDSDCWTYNQGFLMWTSFVNLLSMDAFLVIGFISFLIVLTMYACDDGSCTCTDIGSCCCGILSCGLCLQKPTEQSYVNERKNAAQKNRSKYTNERKGWIDKGKDLFGLMRILGNFDDRNLINPNENSKEDNNNKQYNTQNQHMYNNQNLDTGLKIPLSHSPPQMYQPPYQQQHPYTMQNVYKGGMNPIDNTSNNSNYLRGNVLNNDNSLDNSNNSNTGHAPVHQPPNMAYGFRDPNQGTHSPNPMGDAAARLPEEQVISQKKKQQKGFLGIF